MVKLPWWYPKRTSGSRLQNSSSFTPPTPPPMYSACSIILCNVTLTHYGEEGLFCSCQSNTCIYTNLLCNIFHQHMHEMYVNVWPVYSILTPAAALRNRDDCKLTWRLFGEWKWLLDINQIKLIKLISQKAFFRHQTRTRKSQSAKVTNIVFK